MSRTTIQIRLSDDAKKAWEELASEAGLSLSAYCRAMITKGIAMSLMEKDILKDRLQQFAERIAEARADD